MTRHTRQRDVIERALQHNTAFCSAQQLHQQLQEQGESISLATVYRQLNQLADTGAVDTVRYGGEQLFRYCGSDAHHHHLICTSCGKTVAIDPPSETWFKSVAANHDFLVESHTLEIFGLCADCQKKQRRDQ